MGWRAPGGGKDIPAPHGSSGPKSPGQEMVVYREGASGRKDCGFHHQVADGAELTLDVPHQGTTQWRAPQRGSEEHPPG